MNSTTAASDVPESPIGWRGRSLQILALSAILIIGSLFVIATRLEPASQGLGTHHQLGLPPCSLRVLFNIGFAVKLSKKLKLRLDYEVNHDSLADKPPINTEKTNSKYRTSLIYRI